MSIIRKIVVYILLKIIGGKETMAVIYATLICKGLMTFDDVFPVCKEQTYNYLAACGVPGYTVGGYVENAQ